MAYTVADVLTYARYLCQTDTNGLTDSAGLAFTNDAKNEQTKDLAEKGIDAAQTAEAYVSIAVNANPPGQFAWPSDMLALKTVEIDYSGAGGQNYLQAQPLDVANIQFVSWDYLRANQPTTMPLFDNRGDTGEVFPSPTSAAALIRIFYFKQPDDYTSTSSAIAYPQSIDYRCIAAKVAYLYLLSLEKGGKKLAGQAMNMDAEYEKRMNKIANILAPASKQPIQATPVQINGWNY